MPMTNNNIDSPILQYEQRQKDGRPQAAWFHPDHDEPLVGTELGEQADNPDEWSLRWSCPCCGTVQPPDDELEAAGMSSIHVPCATDDDLEAARKTEARVEKNIENAKAFDSGAYDK